LEIDVQELWAGEGNGAVRIPDPEVEVVPGVAWGTAEVPNTPAYWAVRCRWEDSNPDYVTKQATLVEETGFCLLGGYGIKYEVNAAAFDRLQAASVFDLDIVVEEAEILALLKAPLRVNSRDVRYRFPNQRARRLMSMRDSLRKVSLTGRDPHVMRQALLAIEGIGPKTASWIVRNVLGSDEVAIIDIHILRACTSMGVFPSDIRLPRDYEPLEQRFIAFSNAIEVRPSVLDAVMWSEMRSMPARTWAQHPLDS
jgi:thermostable 8-oxoguanine DNA glycosylase